MHRASRRTTHRTPAFVLVAAAACAGVVAAPPAAGQELGEFEAHGDVGDVKQPGSVRFDAKSREYRVTGGGENMWGTKDAFHYVWRRLSGDLALTADVSFPEAQGQPHRKAGWIVRQGLEADAPYADVAVHGDGLISLQYRLGKGGATLGGKSPLQGPP